MRIAVAGTHFSGKSTLVEALAERLKGYDLVEEPYHRMAGEGYEFADVPSVDDFLEQLKVSVESIRESGADALFDRSPLDFLAYGLSVPDRGSVDLEEWLELCREGVDELDLIVFCPVEEPDRIAVPRSEDRKLRLRVDEKLRDFVLDDSFGILGDVNVIEVTGSIEKRVSRVLESLK